MSRADHLDYSDLAAVRRFLADLRVAVDDADAITRDALRPLGRRELGRILHRRNYQEARARIVSLIGYAMPSEPDGGSGDSPGSGGTPSH